MGGGEGRSGLQGLVEGKRQLYFGFFCVRRENILEIDHDLCLLLHVLSIIDQ